MNQHLEQFIRPELREILAQTPALSQAFLVGGWVRDALLGQAGKDVDIEVFGVTYEDLAVALAPWGRTDRVGRSFGVVKLTMPSGTTYDFTVPRRDSKVASGHKGFEITFDPDIGLEEAASRRDFTINSLMFDPRRGELLDFFGGVEDLTHHCLRHTSEAFTEDPLRVLRGMQFAARFDLRAAPETVALSRRIRSRYSELAVERVREEWFKWAGKSVVPSRGLRYLVETEWVTHFPEVSALIGTPQDPEWHPEGDVFIHTCHCLDALVQLAEWQARDVERRIVASLAVLAHDFAKPVTTHHAVRDGLRRIVSPGHEDAGGPLAESFLTRIGAPHAIRERVVPLVMNHLAHLQSITDRSVRRLAKRLQPATIEELLIVITADQFGRPPKPQVHSDGLLALKARAGELQVQASAPKPVLMGRHLIEVGLKPGREFGALLEAAYEAQLEGAISNLAEAWQWLAHQKDVPLHDEVRSRIEGRLRPPPPGEVGNPA
jgi:tRNA nucleotidyltransferase (CCA-adding enzyme)